MSNPKGINQYTGKGGSSKVKSAIFQTSFNGRAPITVGQQSTHLKNLKVLSKTPMPGARGYTMASPRDVQARRKELASVIKSIRNKK